MVVTATIKRRLIDIVLIVLSGMILLGIGIVVYLLNANKNIIKINIEPDETQFIEFEELHLCPGESCEYTVVLKGGYSEEYRLTLGFADEQPALSLKSYACVRVEADGETIYSGTLMEAFEYGEVVMTMRPSKDKKSEFKVIYYMPDEVGNEAQNAEEDFRLLVTATNE